MKKIWLQHYPPNVPSEIDTTAYTSVVQVIEEAIQNYGDSPAYSNLGTTLTFNQLDIKADKFAAYLQQKLNIRKGDCVAIMMPNLLQYPVALLGIMRTGAMIANVNPLYTARELQHQLNDANANTIIVFADSTPTLAEAIPETGIKHVIVVQTGDLLEIDVEARNVDARLTDIISFKETLSDVTNFVLEPVEVSGADICLLQYTGGTTGVSKGAVLTHANIVANILQTSLWLKPKLKEREEIVITALPIYHIFALTVNCLVFLHLGGHNVLITNPRDMPGFVNELEKWPFSVITGVNTLYNGLLNTPGFNDLDFSSLKCCIGGGAALQQTIAEQWYNITGSMLHEGYGLSETSPVLCVDPITQDEFKHGIGFPLPSTEISLRNEQGEEVPVGEEGELCANGPQVMQGYWNRPEETKKVMTHDGFFCTGDIAVADNDGRFRIVDRKKDMILVSGFNVFPNEIEDVVASCEGVLEVACIGVPDERSGESVKVFIVKKPDQDVTVEHIKTHCKTNLTAYKVPKHYQFIDALPKSPVGKILRRELRA